MGKRPIKKRVPYIIGLLFLAALLLAMPVLWYSAPPIIRIICYKKFCPGVYNRIVEDDQFSICKNGLSKTYDFNNEYAIPFVIEWYITQNNGADIPSDPKRSSLYGVKIQAELLIDDKILSTVTNTRDIPLVYSINLRTGEKCRYFHLLYCDFPARYKFSNHCKLRITILDSDPRLNGLKGMLTVKPRTTL